MLSGRYPEQKLVPSYVEHPDNLFSLLAPDYRIRAFETITQLCDPALCVDTRPAGATAACAGSSARPGRWRRHWPSRTTTTAPVSDQFAEKSAGSVTHEATAQTP